MKRVKINSKVAMLVAMLAITFTFNACGSGSGGISSGGEEVNSSSSGGDDTGETQYDYCITADKSCLTGPFTASNCNGQLSNSCPYSSSSDKASSSSVNSSSSNKASSSSVNSSSSNKASSSSVNGDNKTYNYCIMTETQGNKRCLTGSFTAENCGWELSDSCPYQSSSSSIPKSSSSILSSSSYSTSVIYGGETYETVVIGTQTWFKRDLNYDPGTGNSACYNNNASYCISHGRLYDWATAMTVCPSGWHLPSNADWDKLYRYVDGSTGTSSPYESSTAGRYLKATSVNGQNTSGFSALLGGASNSGGTFSGNGNYGYWWSSSGYNNNSSNAYYRDMAKDSEGASYNDISKATLFSVRCVRD
jgi:uncharacterized protein (TIGR02145 family)